MQRGIFQNKRDGIGNATGFPKKGCVELEKGILLEQLADLFGCFISSLRQPEITAICLHYLKRLPPELFSLEEWKYSLLYLTGHPCPLLTYEELPACLEQEAVALSEQNPTD